MTPPPCVPPSRVIRAIIHRIEQATVAALGHAGAARLLVAVSGGADSSAALIALTERAARHGWRIEAAYVDHGIAPPEVRTGFRQAVHTLAAACAVPLQVAAVDLDARQPGLEAAARSARYTCLAGCAQQVGADAIVTGHTADDQVETILLHLIRGSGIDGLTGMRACAPLPTDRVDLPVLIRPLLAITRAETEATCRAFGIKAAHDPSNRDPAFLRNRVRSELLPLLREFNPAVGCALRRLAATARTDLDALETLTARARAALDVERRDTALGVSRAELQGQPAAIRRRLLRALALEAGAAPLSAERTVALDRLAERGGAMVQLGNGVSAWAHGDRLAVGRDSAAP